MKEFEITESPSKTDEPVSVDDSVRVEMRWTPRLQEKLEKWQTRVSKASTDHNKAAKKHKYRYRLLGIPAALIPLCVGILSPYINQPIIMAVMLAIAACLSAVNTSLNYGASMQKHYNTENDYCRLSFKLQYILAQPKSDRQPADVIMTEIRFTLSEIAAQAPDL